MKTLIIGGGLSGLALACALEDQGMEYLLIEARPRWGGRIKTEHSHNSFFDMGPAWFWPAQPRIAALIEQLALEKFDQFADGMAVFEDAQGQVQHSHGIASMEGSWRLQGGLGALVQALEQRIPQQRKRLGAAVKTLAKNTQGITATLASSEALVADHVVLALPPRIAATLNFIPALPDTTLRAMAGIPTWMAGQAKAVATYKTAFWREEGLSGDGASRLGPMVEIHDASPHHDGAGALFGFIGVPPAGRYDTAGLRARICAQLGRLFGPQAARPETLYVKDWAFDPFTATPADTAPLYAHPTYGLPSAIANIWDGTLHFSGTEVAPQFGGYLEGALEAAEKTRAVLVAK
ncbi:FAD-dependent oxidoreductase [uncultured Sulfitobacter sp.]|uniref:flavin monoamine oxidase family protein n=1 Tax=uncultured Sulfitobacter sp. TaxID=191468 RepID=UPI00263A1476|nr:FAD-dependent oxidoreductase [uncultured Sulfitobacter sp.]